MLYPVAVAFMPEKEISGYDFSDWFTSRLRDFVNWDLCFGSNSLLRDPVQQTNNLSLEFIRVIDMAVVEFYGPNRVRVGMIVPVLMQWNSIELQS